MPRPLVLLALKKSNSSINKRRKRRDKMRKKRKRRNGRYDMEQGGKRSG
jgi:hypothetical protein